jgi:hypothetical protein
VKDISLEAFSTDALAPVKENTINEANNKTINNPASTFKTSVERHLESLCSVILNLLHSAKSA